MKNEALRNLENLSHQRLNLARQFSAQSAAAFQCLDNEDVEGFTDHIKSANAFPVQIDVITKKMEASLPQLGTSDAAVVRSLFASGQKGMVCPQWCAALASDWMNLTKLLKNCVSMNARMEARARVITGQLQKQIDHSRTNHKLRNRYFMRGSNTSGARINYTSR